MCFDYLTGSWMFHISQHLLWFQLIVEISKLQRVKLHVNSGCNRYRDIISSGFSFRDETFAVLCDQDRRWRFYCEFCRVIEMFLTAWETRWIWIVIAHFCAHYETAALKYRTQVHVLSESAAKSTRWRDNATGTRISEQDLKTSARSVEITGTKIIDAGQQNAKNPAYRRRGRDKFILAPLINVGHMRSAIVTDDARRHTAGKAINPRGRGRRHGEVSCATLQFDSLQVGTTAHSVVVRLRTASGRLGCGERLDESSNLYGRRVTG